MSFFFKKHSVRQSLWQEALKMLYIYTYFKITLPKWQEALKMLYIYTYFKITLPKCMFYIHPHRSVDAECAFGQALFY